MTKTRSVKAYTQEFYPLVGKLGWQKALGHYANVVNVEEFYERFSKILDESIGVQIKMLAALKP